MIAVLMISSLLNVAYLLPLVARGFFLGSTEGKPVAEAPLLCWLPPATTAIGCIILFFFAGEIEAFLFPITAAF